MENHSDLYLVEAMDHLWFHKTVLFSSQFSQEDEVSLVLSALTLSKVNESKIENQMEKKRPRRLKIHASKSFSYSSPISSRSAKRKSKNLKYSGSLTVLNKTMSCKSLEELEIEEVKGFIDLGFKFNVEKLNPRVIKVLPGLQRLKNQENQETGEEEERNEIKRPYLSEAWIVQKSELPLIKLKVADVGIDQESDLKKHIKNWARIVAYSIAAQQES